MNRFPPSDQIIEFYSGVGTDANGRRIEDIWQWDDVRLETVHDYIQWLFPLGERSQFSPAAPVLTEKTVEAFRRDASLQMRLKRSLQVMLEFYGLRLEEALNGAIQIERAPSFAAKSQNWLSQGNHNHFRLTRIISSTKVLGLGNYSFALFTCLGAINDDCPRIISPETYGYWKNAAH